MSNNARNTRFRVDFVVREVCDDGSVPDDDLRSIHSWDDVPIGGLRDFFKRTGDAMSLIFKPIHGTQALAFANTGMNKISVIKLVREMTGAGLRDAKEMVEADPGTAIMKFKDHAVAAAAAQRFSEAGATVVLRPLLPSDNERKQGLHPIANVNSLPQGWP